jgi:hypothetical protein
VIVLDVDLSLPTPSLLYIRLYPNMPMTKQRDQLQIAFGL